MSIADQENQGEPENEPETQTEASGTPPIPPKKTALGYNSSGGNWPFSGSGTREWWLGFLIDQRLHGIPWREISSEHMQSYKITREEVDKEVRRRKGSVS